MSNKGHQEAEPAPPSGGIEFRLPRSPAVLRYCHFASPLGELLLVSDGEALRGLYLERARYLPVLEEEAIEDGAAFTSVRAQLEEYFAGARRSFQLAVAPVGTPFQLSVWRALVGIPYGATASYADVAAVIDRPTATRAVGAANGRNPISVIVPCHRVIGANGSLTGYAGGLERKHQLLELERAQLIDALPLSG